MTIGGASGIAGLLDEAIAYEVADKTIPSISYVLFDADEVIAQAHVPHARNPHRFDARTRFRIGSISKTFAAVAALQLVERGRLDLDAEIARYVPGFAPKSPFGAALVTLRKLLSHTSGLVREAAAGHYLDDRRIALSETISGLAGSPLKADPAAGISRYSNAGYAVVGAAIEAASGRSYASHLGACLLDPLGLEDTAIGLSPVIVEALAPASVWTLRGGDVPAPLFDLGCAPAGNITSTLADLASYAGMLLRGGRAADGTTLLAPETLAAMWHPATGDPSAPKGYGLGFAVERLDGWRTVGHGGVVYGYASLLMLLPEAGLGVAMISTLDFTNEIVGRLARYALRLALAAGNNAPAPHPPGRTTLPTPADLELAGYFETADHGASTEIEARDGRLYLVDDDVPLEVRPLGGGRFVLDGRIHGEGTTHPFPQLNFSADGALDWKDQNFFQAERPTPAPPPIEIAPHLGAYAPAFAPTELSWARGRLTCLIEDFCTHECTPVGDQRFHMHGQLYEDEILELDVVGYNGRRGIRVGEMFLARLPA